jgi:ABC-2 type transport system permease protein
VSLVLHQTRYDLLAFSRNREARFFTVALPIIFLVIFATVFGNDTTTVAGHEIKETTYYVPNIGALAIVSAALQSLVFSVVVQRESGILKRRRATPVTPAALILGRALSAVVVAYASFALLAVIGRVAYGATIPGRTLPAVVVAVGVGAIAFACMGFAFASFVKDEDAAAPTLQAILLPLFFISGVFIPADTVPAGVLAVGKVFPIYHLAQALLIPYDPHTTGAGFAWGHLAVVVAWGVVGLVVALRRFSWTPRGR